MATDEVQYTYKATGHQPGRPRGFYTDSSQLDDGVNVQGNLVGVYGEALADSPGTRKAPNGTGVCGWGDNIGVIGQGRQAGGLGDPDPQAIDDRPTGVLGLAGAPVLQPPVHMEGVVGVRGDTGASQGTGVHGTSLAIGVRGGASNLFGVFGQAQAAASSDPFSADFNPVANTGVLGIGDTYGGVFQVTGWQTPPDPAIAPAPPAFANIQLTSINLYDNQYRTDATPTPALPDIGLPIAPDLPLLGHPGDIIVVRQTGIYHVPEPVVTVWVCTRAAPAGQGFGATWSRVQFDCTYVTQPIP
jgi:hypothetical protein